MAELSPDLAARIESLKASHAENPARFFMPLASAYREAGEIGRAEELLRENLKRHPGYLSAHVLLGRCLADRGAVAEARNEFQYVLSVDPQNLIALRTLGDMAAAAGDQPEARRWYGELLSVDPMNAEARQALQAIDAQPPAAPAPERDAHGFGAADLEGAAPDAAETEAAEPGAWGEVRLDEAAAQTEAADRESDAGPAPAAGPSGWGEVDLAADEQGGGAGEAAEPAGAAFEALDFGAVDVPTTSEEVDDPTTPDEVDVPAASEESGPAGRREEDAGEAAAPAFDAWGSVDDGQIEAGSAAPLEGLEGFFAEEHEPAHDADEGEVVTETMAELYARQGFLDRAADVYRELISRRGAEPSLVRRLEELEARRERGAAPEDADAAGPELGRDEEPDFMIPAADDPPAWLQAVDAASAEPGSAGLPDLGLEPGLPDLGLDTTFGAEDTGLDAEAAEAREDEQPAGAAEASFGAAEEEELAGEAVEHFAAAEEEPFTVSGGERQEPDAAFAPAATGDPFADSFAHGFAGAAAASAAVAEAPAQPLDFAGAEAEGAFEDDRAPWEPPAVEETEPAPAVAEQLAAAAGETRAAESPEPAVAGAEGGARTIRSYITAVLAWRPGARAAAAPESPAPDSSAPESTAADSTAPASAESVDELSAATVEEPRAGEAPVEAPPAAEEVEPQPGAPVGDEETAPWETPAAGREQPWEAPSAGDEEEGEDLPWITPEREASAAEAPAAHEAPRGDELMPWDTPFELADDDAGPAAAEAEARPEPGSQEPGGFSFEDFFSASPEEPAGSAPPPAVEAGTPLEAAPSLEPVHEPGPEPASAAPAGEAPQAGTPAGEEDEDLESFQAWLQSLKR